MRSQRARRPGVAMLALALATGAAPAGSASAVEVRGPARAATTEAWPGPPGLSYGPTFQDDPNCPDGHTCTGFRVTCDWNGSRTARGWYAEDDRNGTIGSPRGLVVLLSGGEGRGYNWLTQQSVPFRNQLIAAGLGLIHVRWNSAWNVGPPGDRTAGMANLACRPVGAVRFIHEQEYVPLEPSPAPLECGFCVIGNSDGADALAYPLSHYGAYGLEGILDAVVPVSGPQQGAMLRGCRGAPGYQWDGAHLIDIDESYGYRYTAGDPNPPPCFRGSSSPTWTGRWNNDGVDTGGSDYDHPDTRVHLILGAVDKTTVRNHARAWETALDAASPSCSFADPIGSRCHEEFVQQMDVKVRSDPEGLAAVRDALLWQAP